jgi:tetratricopeptide (TPR) repeat protein
MALCCAKAKDYTKAIEYYNYLLDNFLAENMDYLNLGKCFYNIKDYKNADTTFATFNTLQPDNIQGFIWRARTKSNIDLKDSLGFNITGYAVQLFEGVIQKTQVDTVKFIKERFESFDYLAFYHYSQFSRDQKLKFEAEKALNYYIRMRSTNPNDEKILLVKPLIETLRTKIK